MRGDHRFLKYGPRAFPIRFAWKTTSALGSIFPHNHVSNPPAEDPMDCTITYPSDPNPSGQSPGTTHEALVQPLAMVDEQTVDVRQHGPPPARMAAPSVAQPVNPAVQPQSQTRTIPGKRLYANIPWDKLHEDKGATVPPPAKRRKTSSCAPPITYPQEMIDQMSFMAQFRHQ